MRYFFVVISGVLEVLIFGPARAVENFFIDVILGRGIVGEIVQDHKDAQWRREFLAQKQLERTNRNPFVNQNQQQQNSRNPFLNSSKTKTMQWGRSSQNRKSKP
jgi:hypothetical protein